MKFMQKLQKMKQNKKGFTLVELIIAIVILAILFAILIPSFVGYVNRANEAQVQVEARAAYLAANTLAAEALYETAPAAADVLALAGLTGSGGTVTVTLSGTGEVSVEYVNHGYTATLPGGTVVENP